MSVCSQCAHVCLTEASGFDVNGANWPSELFPVKRKEKPLGMYRRQRAIYLGYALFFLNWQERLACTKKRMHTHTDGRDTLSFCLKHKSAPLLPRLKHKHTSKVFSFIFSFFLFLEAMQPVQPLLLKSLSTFFMCPFLASCLCKKAPVRQQNLLVYIQLYNWQANLLALLGVHLTLLFMYSKQGPCILHLLLLLPLLHLLLQLGIEICKWREKQVSVVFAYGGPDNC